jgi:hypothetical protein
MGLASAGRMKVAGFAIASLLAAAVIVGVMSLFDTHLKTIVASRMILHKNDSHLSRL